MDEIPNFDGPGNLEAVSKLPPQGRYCWVSSVIFVLRECVNAAFQGTG